MANQSLASFNKVPQFSYQLPRNNIWGLFPDHKAIPVLQLLCFCQAECPVCPGRPSDPKGYLATFTSVLIVRESMKQSDTAKHQSY